MTDAEALAEADRREATLHTYDADQREFAYQKRVWFNLLGRITGVTLP